MRKWITIGAAFAAALTAFVGGGAPAQAQAWQELTQKELATVSSIDLARKVLKSETIEDLRRASVNGDARATWLLGYSYKQGLGGVTKDLRQSYILSREACQMGSPRGCDALAFNLVAGNGTDKNVVEAARLFESVCDRGIASSCERLATVYYRGEGGIPKTLGRALFFRKRGCEIGSMYNCHLVGQMYSKGEGTEADPERAQAFNARSCDGGYGRGCFYAGRIIERAASRNDPAAFSSIARYYEKGCALEQKDSCYNRGIIDNEGKFGRPRSTIAAVPWMEKACKFRSNDACYNLGSWLINGRAGRTDGKRAIELLGPLCLRDRNPDIQACNNAGTAAYRGSGIPSPDYDSARKFYTRACYEGALTASCRTLSDMYRDKQIIASAKGEAEWLDAQLCFKANENAYCKSTTGQYRVLEQASAEMYSSAAITAGNLCREGDSMGCRTEFLLKACAKASGTSPVLKACRRSF